jgi:hypothetical protein
MAKKIKSFTVEEDIYKRLVSMFKKHKAETSVSAYVNNKLKELLWNIEDIEKGIKEMNYSIPMKFVIDDTVRGCENPHRWSSEPDESPGISELEHVLMITLDEYEADQKGIPREYYSWLKNDNYKLSKDKKFIIDKTTGKKFISIGASQIREVSDIDHEEINRNTAKIK